MAAPLQPAVLVISGIPGAGKSTISALVARRLERAAHIEAEVLQRFVASGGAWPDGQPHEEAMRQLRLRGRNVALLADSFFEAGITPIIDDVVIATRLDELRADLQSRPLLFVLLVPDLDAVRARNRERPNKNVFEAWRHLDRPSRATRRRGSACGSTPRSRPHRNPPTRSCGGAWREARV